MHAQSTEENNKHGRPHVILHQSMTEAVHPTSVPEDGIEQGTENGEDERDSDQNTERVHVVLIDCL